MDASNMDSKNLFVNFRLRHGIYFCLYWCCCCCWYCSLKSDVHGDDFLYPYFLRVFIGCCFFFAFTFSVKHDSMNAKVKKIKYICFHKINTTPFIHHSHCAYIWNENRVRKKDWMLYIQCNIIHKHKQYIQKDYYLHKNDSRVWFLQIVGLRKDYTNIIN